MYTDGSLTEFYEGAVAGGTCHFFSFYKGVEKNTTNVDGEIDTIYLYIPSKLIHLVTKLSEYCHIIIFKSNSTGNSINILSQNGKD